MKIRRAQHRDVPKIVAMLADDPLGRLRENFVDPIPDSYYDAFDKIAGDDSHELVVVCEREDDVVGTLQLTFLQYLTYQGGIRALIEAVRIREDQRGKGVGEHLIAWAINRAKERGAHIIQLTSDKERVGAIRFYERLGFKASHEGMKLKL